MKFKTIGIVWLVFSILYNEFIIDFNKHIDETNASSKKINQISALGYFVSALTAFFSAFLTMCPIKNKKPRTTQATLERTKPLLDERYEYITQQLRYLDDKIFRSFVIFIQLATVIIGGVFYLHQHNVKGIELVLAANGVFLGVAFGIIFLISNNLRSWLGYRKTLMEDYDDNSNVRRIGWCSSEAVTCLGIALANVGFLFINPLNKSYPSEWIRVAAVISLLISLMVGIMPFLLSRLERCLDKE
ncbi:MAG: hypothetical protein HYZ84_00765 [Candidatus Omnitrophica bacterium]|nr:hypothetical protein [Candidatus Omnitrophota bacterium]